VDNVKATDKVRVQVRQNVEQQKKFIFGITVYLGHTNAEGNVYFANFFEWQGMAREEFYKTFVPNHMEILKRGVRIITVEAHIEFKNQLFLFDQVSIQVNTRNVRTASLELVFSYKNKNTGELVANGYQKLAFAGPDGKIIPIPEEVKRNAKWFLIEEEPVSRVRSG